MSENIIYAGLGEDDNISAEGDIYYTVINMMKWMLSHHHKPPYTVISTPEIWKLAHTQLWKYLPIDYKKINNKEREKLRMMMKSAFKAIVELENIIDWEISLDLEEEIIILTNGIEEVKTGHLTLGW